MAHRSDNTFTCDCGCGSQTKKIELPWTHLQTQRKHGEKHAATAACAHKVLDALLQRENDQAAAKAAQLARIQADGRLRSAIPAAGAKTKQSAPKQS
jgi:hypothetical protein